MAAWFAAVGLSDAVWGYGETVEAAREDAERWLAEGDSDDETVDDLDFRPITEKQAARVKDGCIDWNDLCEGEGVK